MKACHHFPMYSHKVSITVAANSSGNAVKIFIFKVRISVKALGIPCHQLLVELLASAVYPVLSRIILRALRPLNWGRIFKYM